MSLFSHSSKLPTRGFHGTLRGMLGFAVLVPLVAGAPFVPVIDDVAPPEPLEEPAPDDGEAPGEELTPGDAQQGEYELWRQKLFDQTRQPEPEKPKQAKPKVPVQRAIGVSAGVGVAGTTETDISNRATGFSVEVEYLWRFQPWLTPSLYAGGLFTGPGSCSSGDSSVSPCDVQHLLVYAGGQVHLMIPIPYVGPFFELGLGLGAGGINTVIGDDLDKERVSAFPHFRIGLGVDLGEKHSVSLGFGFMSHFTAETLSGRFAIGLAFPLGA